jgi:hypothetical protein
MCLSCVQINKHSVRFGCTQGSWVETTELAVVSWATSLFIWPSGQVVSERASHRVASVADGNMSAAAFMPDGQTLTVACSWLELLDKHGMVLHVMQLVRRRVFADACHGMVLSFLGGRVATSHASLIGAALRVFIVLNTMNQLLLIWFSLCEAPFRWLLRYCLRLRAVRAILRPD